MDIWGITHRGVVREQNQDAFVCDTLADGRVVALVCDGMGGARAGNVASTMAVELFMEVIKEGEVPQGEDIVRCMRKAAERANHQVFQRATQDDACIGMGTTLVAAIASDKEATILNEGDSRAYYITKEGITRITRDHSLVEDLVLRGELTPEEARTHPKKNLITRALGADPELKADVFHNSFAGGDYLLLCSDGLSNIVTEQEILYEVIHGGEADTCCQRLLDIALHRGAPDNVTVVLVQN